MGDSRWSAYLIVLVSVADLGGCKPRIQSASLSSESSSGLNADYISQCGSSTLLVQADDPAASTGNTAFALEGDDGDGGAQAPADLASKVRGVLENNSCTSCHTPDNAEDQGPIKDILDVSTYKALTAGGKSSGLYRAVASGKMPKGGDKLNATDLATLREWLNAGAPSLAGGDAPVATGRRFDFISDLSKVACMAVDLDKLDERHRPYARYLTLTHLYNAGLPESKMTVYRQAISKLINSLSWHKKITRPLAIDPAGSIFRIDLRAYKWTDKTWDSIISRDPYKVELTHDRARYVYDTVRTTVPAIRGDWFLFAASVPPLYHDILKLPSQVNELEKLLGVDARGNIEDETVVRAGFNGSGVSQNNRLLERHISHYGAYWKSYDFGSNAGRKNLFAFPLGPKGAFGSGSGDTYAFEEDGGEMIFNLPNGLQGYFLADKLGNRIDKGPIEIVSDPKRPDRTVVNGLSCMGCHVRGMIRKDDQIRKALERNDGFSGTVRAKILALYREQTKYDELIGEDEVRFDAALSQAGATVRNPEPVFALSQSFEAEVDLAHVAAELGMKSADFTRRLSESPILQRELAALLSPGGTVKRDQVTAVFPSAVNELRLGKANVVVASGSSGGHVSGSGCRLNSFGMSFCSVEGRAYEMQETEMTWGMWKAFKGSYVSFPIPNGFGAYCSPKVLEDDHPVSCVSFNDARNFVTDLNDIERDFTYRLPTEKEWIDAAGDISGPEFGWCHVNSGGKTPRLIHQKRA